MNTVSPELEQQWRALHAEMSLGRSEDTALAGLFQGYRPSDFFTATHRIFYAGKATRGSFHEPNAAEHAYKNIASAFWRFRVELVEALKEQSTESVSLCWSNICKIGVSEGNPNKRLQEAQRALAANTLRQEWADLKPTLIVFTSANYADDIVYDALNVTRGADGFETHKAADGTEFYSRPADKDGYAAILWMPHPERKKLELKSEWLKKALELIG